jgi:hypothetical protein
MRSIKLHKSARDIYALYGGDGDPSLLDSWRYHSQIVSEHNNTKQNERKERIDFLSFAGIVLFYAAVIVVVKFG